MGLSSKRYWVKHNDISYMHLFSDGNLSYWTIARFIVDYPDLIKNEL